MTNLEFVAAIVEALAWPAAVVVVALVFQSQIKSLFNREKGGVSVGPFSVTWEGWERAVRADLAAEEADAPKRPTLAPTGGALSDELAPIIEVSPGAAIVEAFGRVEYALQQLLGDKAPPTAVLGNRIEAALKLNLITEETARAIEGLRVMRNLAAHGRTEELTRERAMDYIVLTDAVLYAMRTKA